MEPGEPEIMYFRPDTSEAGYPPVNTSPKAKADVVKPNVKAKTVIKRNNFLNFKTTSFNNLKLF